MKHVFVQYDRAHQPAHDPYRYCPMCRAELAEGLSPGRRACPACGFIHFRNPFPTVTVCIRRDGRILLGRRADPPGQGRWAIPGGYIEYEEDFLSAGVREMKEETGLDIRITGILNLASSFLSPRWHYLNVCLLAEVAGGELRPGAEFEAIQWYLPGSELPDMAFAEDVENLRALSLPGFHFHPVEP